MRHTIFLALFTFIVALAGCEPNTPEERLESAGEKLDDAQLSLEALETRIEQQKDVLATLKKQRRATKSRLMTLEERVEARATDVAVFRAVQSALLAEPDLKNAAITVDAESGTVELSGIVSTQAEADAAVSIAEGTAGVEKVKSRMEVESPEKGAEAS